MSYKKQIKIVCDSCETSQEVDDVDDVPTDWVNVDASLNFASRYDGDISLCDDCKVEAALSLLAEHVLVGD